MGKQTKGPLPAEVEELQMQLQEWRLTHPRPDLGCRRPLAIRFGVCQIGRAVGQNYTWLCKKVTRAKEVSSARSTAFLELPAGMDPLW